MINLRHILMTLLIATLTLALSTSCSNDKKNLLVTSPTLPTNPIEVLSSSKKAMSSIKSYQFYLSHRMADGSKIDQSLTLVDATGSVSRDSGIYLESQLLFGNIPVSAGIVKTEDTTYLRDPLTQKWQMIKEDTNPFDFLDPDTMIASIIDDVYEPHVLSSKGKYIKISGKISPSSFDYIFQDTISEDVNLTIWIDDQSSVIARAEIAGKISESDPNEIIRVLEISRIDDVKDIATPDIR